MGFFPHTPSAFSVAPAAVLTRSSAVAPTVTCLVVGWRGTNGDLLGGWGNNGASPVATRPARWLWHQRRLPGHADGIRSVDGSHGALTMQCAGAWEYPQRPPTSIHVVRQSDAAMWVAWATAAPQTGPDNTTQALTYTALLRNWLPDCPPGGGTPGWLTVGPASPLGRRAMGSALRVRPACGCRGRMPACRLWASPCWHPPDVSNRGSHGCGNGNSRGCCGPTRDI